MNNRIYIGYTGMSIFPLATYTVFNKIDREVLQPIWSYNYQSFCITERLPFQTEKYFRSLTLGEQGISITNRFASFQL